MSLYDVLLIFGSGFACGMFFHLYYFAGGRETMDEREREDEGC